MRRSAAITVLAVSVGLLCACTADVEETPNVSPSHSSAAPSPSPTMTENPTTPGPEPSPSPSPSETLDAEQLAARDIVGQFFTTLGELRKDPDMSVQSLADITTGETQRNYIENIAQYRLNKTIQVGDSTWTFTEIGPVSNFEGGVSVSLEVCTDSSNVDIIDQETGESTLPADRPTAVYWYIEAVTENDRWKVGDLTSDIVDSCSP